MGGELVASYIRIRPGNSWIIVQALLIGLEGHDSLGFPNGPGDVG